MNKAKAWQPGHPLDSVSGFEQRVYLVEVTQQGSIIATHTVKAPDALTAINLVEPQYGEPTKVQKVSVEDEDGERHQVMMASNWHGYMFHARAISSAVESITDSQ